MKINFSNLKKVMIIICLKDEKKYWGKWSERTFIRK
ncbi:MAG: hypothetical protein MRERC_1c225 [Mycoplasmataceae bacterium RC_NB112A]|nr:MAG: hypothetical protein MRERC_1c225 [Mycoplasmataceae bacterium RC_NB112A]